MFRTTFKIATNKLMKSMMWVFFLIAMPGMKTYICENKNAKTNIGIIVAAFKKNGVVKIRSNSLENRENTKKNKRANDEKYLNIIDSSFGELSFL